MIFDSYGKKLYDVECVSIVQNESDNIIGFLDNICDVFDNIIIIDGGSIDDTIDLIKSHRASSKIKLYKNKFNYHFGDQKNLAISKTDSLFTFVIDADERLNNDFKKDLHDIVFENQNKDVIVFDRHNYVNGEKETNFIEPQLKLFKSFCRYIGCVHEELVGWRQENKIFLDKKYYIVHDKSMEKYIKNNEIIFMESQIKMPQQHLELSRRVKYEKS